MTNLSDAFLTAEHRHRQKHANIRLLSRLLRGGSKYLGKHFPKVSRPGSSRLKDMAGDALTGMGIDSAIRFTSGLDTPPIGLAGGLASGLLRGATGVHLPSALSRAVPATIRPALKSQAGMARQLGLYAPAVGHIQRQATGGEFDSTRPYQTAVSGLNRRRQQALQYVDKQLLPQLEQRMPPSLKPKLQPPQNSPQADIPPL